MSDERIQANVNESVTKKDLTSILEKIDAVKKIQSPGLDAGSRLLYTGLSVVAGTLIGDYFLKQEYGKGLGLGAKSFLMITGGSIMVYGGIQRTISRVFNAKPKHLMMAGVLVGCVAYAENCGGIRTSINSNLAGAKTYATSVIDKKVSSDENLAQVNEKLSKLESSLAAQQPSLTQSSQSVNSSEKNLEEYVSNYSGLQIPPTIKKLNGSLLDGGCGGVFYYDKSSNTATLFTRQNNLFVPFKQYKGTSGIDPSPKHFEGQKATPEGIYEIVDTRIEPGLDDLYGVGYSKLNYPNPIDVRAGRTGSGVVISGTNLSERLRAIASQENSTNTGISFQNPDYLSIMSWMERAGRVPVVIENSNRPLAIK